MARDWSSSLFLRSLTSSHSSVTYHFSGSDPFMGMSVDPLFCRLLPSYKYDSSDYMDLKG